MARIFLREDWYAWDCNQASTLSVRKWSSICRMFKVNQEFLPATSARVVFWLTFSGNLGFPKAKTKACAVLITWCDHSLIGLSSRSLWAKACLSWAGTISLKRESGIISSRPPRGSTNVSSVLLQHQQKYLCWCLYIPRDACIGSGHSKEPPQQPDM